MSEIDRLVLNNQFHGRGFRGLTGPNAPRVAIVTCMDARIDVFRTFGLQEGEAHVIRNAGGIVTDDVIRSLLLSQRLLGTREVMLVHHTECAMLKFTDEQLKRTIAADASAVPPFPLGAFGDLREDVLRSIAQVRSSPFLPHRDEVRGFIYDVGSRGVSEVREPTQRRSWASS